MKKGICLQCVKLPVGGGTGVEDVLFGREQRQAVGIKVDRSRVHAGKSFQTTQLLSSLLPTVFGVGVSAGVKNSHSGTPRVVHGRENSSEGMQVHAVWV